MFVFSRLLTGGKSSVFSNSLRRHKNVWKNNVDYNNSFDERIGFQLNKTLNQRNTAFYWIHDDVINRKEFKCKVLWESLFSFSYVGSDKQIELDQYSFFTYNSMPLNCQVGTKLRFQ